MHTSFRFQFVVARCESEHHDSERRGACTSAGGVGTPITHPNGWTNGLRRATGLIGLRDPTARPPVPISKPSEPLRVATSSTVRSASTTPVDPAALAPVLDPAGSACMLPAAAYREDAVLAWERTHLFAGAWVCAGRSSELAAVGVTARRRASATTPSCSCAVRTAPCVASSTSASTGPTSWHRAAATSQNRSIHCPYHGWRYGARRHVGVDTALRRASRRSTARSTASSRSPSRTGTGGSWSTPSGERCTSRRFPRWNRAARRSIMSPSASSSALRTPTRWRRTGSSINENYHECLHCPNIHPELCAVSPSRSGENHRGHTGMWIGGWLGLVPDAVTMSLDGRSAAVPLRNLPGAGPPARRLPRPAAEPARQPSSRLRDDPSPRPHRARPHRCRVPVAVRPGGRRRRRLRTGLRRRLLGPDEPPGLGGVRGTCSAVCRHVATARARSPPPRTPSPSSSAWSPRRT